MSVHENHPIAWFNHLAVLYNFILWGRNLGIPSFRNYSSITSSDTVLGDIQDKWNINGSNEV